MLISSVQEIPLHVLHLLKIASPSKDALTIPLVLLVMLTLSADGAVPEVQTQMDCAIQSILPPLFVVAPCRHSVVAHNAPTAFAHVECVHVMIPTEVDQTVRFSKIVSEILGIPPQPPDLLSLINVEYAKETIANVLVAMECPIRDLNWITVEFAMEQIYVLLQNVPTPRNVQTAPSLDVISVLIQRFPMRVLELGTQLLPVAKIKPFKFAHPQYCLLQQLLELLLEFWQQSSLELLLV